MRRHLLVLPLALSLVTSAGCLGMAPTGTAERIHTANRTISLNGRQHVNMLGVARAPASLISNNMAGNLGKTGLISNNTAGFSVLNLDELAPVADAEVRLVDQFRNPIKGVAPVKSAADGTFLLKNVPAGLSWTIEVKTHGLTLTRLAKAGAKAPLEVTPETTLATEHLHQALAGNKGALLQVPEKDFEALTAELKATISAADVANGLADSNAALNALEKVAAKNPNVAKAQTAVVAEAETAIEAAVQDGSVSPEVVASGGEAVEEAPEATPTPADAPTAEPSPRGGKPDGVGGGKPDDNPGKP